MALRTVLTLIAASGGVTGNEIAAGAINAADKFAAGVVDAAAIGENAIGDSELDTSIAYNFTGDINYGGISLNPSTSLFYAVAVAATISNIVDLATGAPTPVDGVTMTLNDDVLVWKQTTASANGIYNVDVVGTGINGTWTRATERNAADEYPVGMLVYVKGGTDQAGTIFKLTTFAGTLDTDAMTFEVHEEGLTGSAEPEAVGSGDGSTLSFDLDNANVLIAAAVFVGGIFQDPATWSISAGTGAGGVDQLVFGAGNAPGTGLAIEGIFLRRV